MCVMVLVVCVSVTLYFHLHLLTMPDIEPRKQSATKNDAIWQWLVSRSVMATRAVTKTLSLIA